ncbi:hypothetical protein GGR51DRAFT_508590 [Nemania sp. FL0031]|nr:hypothetical protein GGR51DRAFT_508590 [Nemania sp. FL0031]
MPRSGFQEWWRAQLDAPRNATSGPICPCAACFNGTGHGSTNEKRYPKYQMTSKKPQLFGSRESVASDLVPLCSDAASISRFSIESQAQTKKTG